MIEIDGEFFEDPCEVIRAGRQMVAFLGVKAALEQVGLILSQPLFPPPAKGELIVPSFVGGEIVTLQDQILGDSIDAEFGEKLIIGVDPAIPGEDRTGRVK